MTIKDIEDRRSVKPEANCNRIALNIAFHLGLDPGLRQTIQGLQEANNAPAPFDGEWEEEPEEEPEEEEIEDIPLGEGEIDDEYDIF
ncbi:hypothetical protein F511_32298 [Dorcoceras hygrometricum]|uniref:Uncharacterized protein n=1 Tax=Dorcoceras hygrometricum TaxID=472368 RepID=A0A2Z7C0G3_9LAMI|nr:hypothetical protein F511_32298 [Dorcoceras hygrometricum]